jgi:outer membrane protein OmpA-like peptidoglycan-associated protein
VSQPKRPAARRPRRAGRLVLLALVAQETEAVAQQSRVNDYSTAPLQRGSILSLWSSGTLEPGQGALQLGMHARPSASARDTPDGAPPLSTLEFLGTLGLSSAVDASASMAVHRGYWGGSPYTGATSRTALGDVRLVPRFRIWRDAAGSGVGALLATSFQAGNEASLASDGWRIEPRLSANYVLAPLTLTVNAGYLLHASVKHVGEAPNDAVLGGVGAELAVSREWSLVAELASRWHVNATTSALGARLASEARPGLRFAMASWAGQVGGGVALPSAIDAPGWRLLAAISVALPTAPPAGLAHVANSAQPPRVRTPSQALADDTPIPEVPEPVTAPVSEEPAPLPVLNFRPNRWLLDAVQLETLDQVAQRMKRETEHVRLEIHGHSDTSGPRAGNFKLSRKRALTVRLHLMLRGVAWRRLSIIGYGSTRPPASDDQRAARRVEFRLVDGAR